MKSNIKNLMEQKNINITELGKKANIGRTSLSEIVNSDTILEKTRLGTLTSIAKVLNVEFSELFEPDISVEIVYEVKLKDLPVAETEQQINELRYNGLSLFVLLVIKVTFESAVFYYPIVVSYIFHSEIWLHCNLVNEFELLMIKEKNEQIYNEILEFSPMTHDSLETLHCKNLLEKLSHLVFTFHLDFFEQSYDEIEQLYLIRRDGNDSGLLKTPTLQGKIMIYWNHNNMIGDVFSMEEIVKYHDVDNSFVFVCSPSTKEIEKISFKESERVIPEWFAYY